MEAGGAWFVPQEHLYPQSHQQQKQRQRQSILVLCVWARLQRQQDYDNEDVRGPPPAMRQTPRRAIAPGEQCPRCTIEIMKIAAALEKVQWGASERPPQQQSRTQCLTLRTQ